MREVLEKSDAERPVERLAALGQMAAVFCHESRNALQNAMSAAEVLAAKLREQPDLLRYLDQIIEAQGDLRRVHQDILEFTAPALLERAEVKLDSLWQDAWADLAARRAGRDTEFSQDADGIDLTCSVDPHRMKRVFRNLFENSLDACADPMHVWVSCFDVQGEEEKALRVVVRDNGSGLDKTQAAHIFEPFYTNKTKGTGLGMMIVKRIVEKHGGRIDIGPPNGIGFEVVIELPRRAP